MKEFTEKEALNKAAAYCAASEHCLSEVSGKLDGWGVESSSKERILNRLVDERYIDESRYARFFVNDKLRYNKWGKNKIAQGLWQKRIPSSIYSSCLDGIDEEEYVKILQELLFNHRKSVRARDEYELKNKLMRFALGRGFEMDVILRCVKVPDREE